jgi:o-succinylbenzoate synthase
VRIAGLRWDAFAVPLTTPFRTAHGVVRRREGLLIRLTTDDDVEGFGEASPLAEFDGATLADCLAALGAAAPGIVGAPLASLALCLDGLAGRPVPAALRCALDTAALDALGRARGRPVAQLLADRPRANVAVNATIGGVRAEAAVEAARVLVDRGFGTIKLKVGVAGSIGEEIARVAAVHAAIGPAARLRLDANGSWSLDRARRALDAFADLAIELVEQPTSAADTGALAELRRTSPIPIAADEAVAGLEAARRLVDAGAADYLVVKPTMVGGLTVGRAIADLALPAGVGVIVTSAFEAGVGVAAALHLAATLPAEGPACGLATADALAATLVRRLPTVDRGAMTVPTAPGLGVEVNDAELAAYSSASREGGDARA